MFAADDISADFPTPRNDEPASLRQDIVDELRDHLDCALVRELHVPTSRGCRSADQTTPDAAHERVLARFGNPATIARRLWWDSMKERIMAQRFTAIMASIAAAACVAAGVLLYQLLQTSREAQAATLAEMRDFNSQLLAQLSARPAPTSAEAAHWSPMRVKVISATDGAPLAGVNVHLSGGPFDSGKDSSVSVTGVSGADGIVELQTVPYGRYHLIAQAREAGCHTTKNVLVGPNRDETIVLRVPAPPQMITPRFDLETPPSVTGLAFLVELRAQPQNVDGLQWELLQSVQRFLINDVGVAAVADTDYLSPDSGGLQRLRYDLAIETTVPDLPMRVVGVDIVHILERIRDDDGEHVDVLRIGSSPLASREGATATGGSEGAYHVTLPDSFWSHIEREQVRLELKPAPPGMRLTKVAVKSEPGLGRINPGAWIDIVLNYQTSSKSGIETVRLLEQVELFAVQGNYAMLDSGGSPRQLIYTLYLTSEQAELVELAQRTHDAEFIVRTSSAPSDASEAVAVDPELRDRLKQEVSTEATPPNGSGA